MADTTTVLALPFPEGADANDVPADMQALAERLDEAPGIESLTSAQIAALTAGQKPAGRVVYNSTTSKLQVSNGTSFADVDAAALLKAGGTMAGNIAMGNNKVTGLAAASSNGDAVRYEQALLLAGGTMSGNINANGNKVTGLAAASSNGDAVRYEQAFLKSGNNLDLNNAGYVLNILPSGASNDAATVGQVNDVAAHFASGVLSGTTNGSGRISTTLPSPPAGKSWSVTVTPLGMISHGPVAIYSLVGTALTFNVFTWAGSMAASTSVSLYWTAIAY